MRPRPAYYLTDPAARILFPVAARYGSILWEWQEGDLAHETERGVRWIYKQFSRRVGRLEYQLTETDLAFFRTLHETVQGQLTAFYFLEDGAAAASTARRVRKEPHFEPRAQDRGAVVAGGTTSLYDYTLELTEEVTTVSILT